MNFRSRALITAALGLAASFAFPQAWPPELDKVYRDESHCLTSPEMRGERDNVISCFCRDAIVMARYVYSTYLLPRKDFNLNGVFLVLENNIGQQCGENYDAFTVARQKDWKWNGPEVVSTYPPDEVIKRIKPEPGPSRSRWVPFTVQLVYRNDQGHVTKTENYSSRELIPEFSLAK